MTKRVLAAALWFYTGWYAGAFLAHAFGVSELIGPVIGAAAAALIAGDPRHLIWARSTAPATEAPTTESSARVPTAA